MFSPEFQKWAATAYGASLKWDAHDIYFVRIIGTFAFALGLVAAGAARDPYRHLFVPLCFLSFFTLRDIQRHVYWNELSQGFGVSATTNNLTTIFFGAQVVLLLVLVVMCARENRTIEKS